MLDLTRLTSFVALVDAGARIVDVERWIGGDTLARCRTCLSGPVAGVSVVARGALFELGVSYVAGRRVTGVECAGVVVRRGEIHVVVDYLTGNSATAIAEINDDLIVGGALKSCRDADGDIWLAGTLTRLRVTSCALRVVASPTQRASTTEFAPVGVQKHPPKANAQRATRNAQRATRNAQRATRNA